MIWWAACENVSASDIMCTVRSSSWPRFSPRSVSALCALATSPATPDAFAFKCSTLILPGMCLATLLDAFPLASPKSSSLSNSLCPPLKRFLKKLSFGASGASQGRNKSPSISFKLSQNPTQIVNFWISHGEHKYMPWPKLLKQNVRAILRSIKGKNSMSIKGLRLGKLNVARWPLAM